MQLDKSFTDNCFSFKEKWHRVPTKFAEKAKESCKSEESPQLARAQRDRNSARGYLGSDPSLPSRLQVACTMSHSNSSLTSSQGLHLRAFAPVVPTTGFSCLTSFKTLLKCPMSPDSPI
jgi:hypothetical protein